MTDNVRGSTSWLTLAIVLCALATGAWMLFDGSRALIIGDYVTPQSGEYKGQLGPWSGLVEAVGLPARSFPMKCIFVSYGLLWLLGILFFLTKEWGWKVLAGLALITTWYLPVGTMLCILIFGLLIIQKPWDPDPPTDFDAALNEDPQTQVN